MFCPFCGTKVEDEAIFCGSCGKKLPTLIVDRDQLPDDNEVHDQPKDKVLTLSISRFFIYSILTFGFYQIYWGWKCWEILKRLNKLSISSSLRGFFIQFTCFSLFADVLKSAKKSGYKGDYSSG